MLNPLHTHCVPLSRSNPPLSRPWRRFTRARRRVVNPLHTHCMPLSHNRSPLSRPWCRLTRVRHRVVNPHHNYCVPLSHISPPPSRPWRRLTRVRHQVVNPWHNHHVPLPPQPFFQLPQHPTPLPSTATWKNPDYGPGDNLVAGFTQCWLDRDRFVAKASEVYTVHEMEAAEVWAEKNGTNRNLAFEEWYPEDDGDGNANVPRQPHLACKMEVWGNYELSYSIWWHGAWVDRCQPQSGRLETKFRGKGAWSWHLRRPCLDQLC